MQPLPQCRPGPAGRPSLGPEGRKKSRGEVPRRSWRGLCELGWNSCGTVALVWGLGRAGRVGTLKGPVSPSLGLSSVAAG